MEDTLRLLLGIEKRLVKIESLFENHLRSHEKWVWRLLVPILIGVAVILFQRFWQGGMY